MPSQPISKSVPNGRALVIRLSFSVILTLAYMADPPPSSGERSITPPGSWQLQLVILVQSHFTKGTNAPIITTITTHPAQFNICRSIFSTDNRICCPVDSKKNCCNPRNTSRFLSLFCLSPTSTLSVYHSMTRVSVDSSHQSSDLYTDARVHSNDKSWVLGLQEPHSACRLHTLHVILTFRHTDLRKFENKI